MQTSPTGPPRRRRRRGADLLRVLIAVAVLIVSALPVRPDAVGRAERGAFDAVNALADWLYPVIWPIMQLGAIAAVPILAVLAFAMKRRSMALDLTIAGFAAWGAAKVIKASFDRPRPGGLLEQVVVRGHEATGFGFASGHTAVAFALAAVAAPYLPRPWRRLGWGLAVVVGLARIYVGAHLPLDVLGGAALGWGIAALLHLAIGAPTGRPEHEALEASLRDAGVPVASLVPLDVPATASAPYRAETDAGEVLFVKVILEETGDRDVLARAWRWLVRRGARQQHVAPLPATQVRHEAAMAELARSAGIRTAPVHSFHELAGGVAALLLEFIEGRAATGTTDAVRDQVRDALVTLRRVGVVHGDVTPDNVIVDAAGTAWLVDFGRAVFATETERPERDLAELDSWQEREEVATK